MRTIVNIDVPDLAPAIAFYQQAFGLQHTRTLEDDVAELTGASLVIYLLQKAAGSPVSQFAVVSPTSRNYARHWTPVHLDFVVDDLERAAQQALAAGAVREGECATWRGSQCQTFSDPFGHGFCLIAFDNDTYR
jgi:uncharacterized glyoxalase superfamily protein PhnB